MARLTAAEARKLAGPSAQDYVDAALALIEASAKAKCRSICLHGKFWVDEGYSKTPLYREACAELTRLGYDVSFYYHDGSIAVDMYTVVKW